MGNKRPKQQDQCPQTDEEMRDYFFALIGRSLGGPADDYAAVLAKEYPWQGRSLMIPPGVGPGVKQEPNAPFFGLTQQFSGVPKGRVFLPSDQADPEGYYTRCNQYIDDAPGGSGLVWAWYYVAGHAYSPVLPADGASPDDSTGLTEADVQAMIDASMQQAVKLGDKIALRTNSGLLAGLKGGGPTAPDAPINWIGKAGEAHAWESLTIEKGE